MKKIYILILLVFVSKLVLSQYNITTNNGQTIYICNADFSDNTSATYNPNISNTITFKANTTNSGLKFSFSQFDVDVSDTLYVYDGPNTSAPLIGKYNNSNALAGGLNVIQSSIFNSTNATGASLTFKFISDGSNQGTGWYANLICTPVCQKVIAKIDSLLTLPHPVSNNNINACLGQTITLAGKALFPENNIIYHQNASACSYEWNFGDGSTATGSLVNHTYNILSGYEIKLKVTDALGCESNYTLVSKLRFAPQPIATVNPLNPMCTNESQLIKAGYNSNSNVVIEPFGFLSTSKNSFDSLMFIPDGPNCPLGIYNTPLMVTNFPVGTTIQNANDILAICINIEHSFAGDLGFKIVCPNNQFVQLDPNTHSGGNFLGMPSGGANHHAFDNGCLTQNNPAGTTWNYCWSEIYPNNNFTLDQLSSSSGAGTIMVSGSRTIDSTNQFDHTNYIKPQNPFSNLIGCPLNGLWNIEITDDYGSDNGYISHWDIQLQHNTSQVNWMYNVNIDSVKITGPFASSISDTSSLITPLAGGNYNYQVHIKDDFGCAWDTTLALLVVQKPIVNLGTDTSICFGDSLLLNAGNPGAEYLWSTPSGYLNSQTIITDFIFNIIPISNNYIVNVTNSNTTNTFSCTSTDTITVTTNPLPDISFSFSPNTGEGCEPLDISFTDETIPSTLYYLWNFGDGTTSTMQNPIHTFSEGLYDIQLTCTTSQGCTSTVNVNNLINVYPGPHINYSWNPLYATPNNQVTFTNLTTSAISYVWNFGDGDTTTLENPVHTYTQLGSYIVSLSALHSNGCIDTVFNTISVSNTSVNGNTSAKPKIFVDNLNNILQITNITNNSNVNIYDINGKLIKTITIENTITMDISTFAKGIYIIKINSEKETMISKFVKE
jgi:PKD repeat protein